MSNEINEIEENIKKFIDSLGASPYEVPEKVHDLQYFTYDSYEDLLDNLKNGRAEIIRNPSKYDKVLVELLANNKQKTMSIISAIILFGGSINFIILSFYNSFWYLLGVPAVAIIAFILFTRANNKAFFHAASNSEFVFCFLYSSNLISVQDHVD